jgi:hypothetical protein
MLNEIEGLNGSTGEYVLEISLKVVIVHLFERITKREVGVGIVAGGVNLWEAVLDR